RAHVGVEACTRRAGRGDRAGHRPLHEGQIVGGRDLLEPEGGDEVADLEGETRARTVRGPEVAELALRGRELPLDLEPEVVEDATREIDAGSPQLRVVVGIRAIRVEEGRIAVEAAADPEDEIGLPEAQAKPAARRGDQVVVLAFEDLEPGGGGRWGEREEHEREQDREGLRNASEHDGWASH